MMKEPCKCGQVQAVYLPDENQYEPPCWECYYNDDVPDVPTEFWEPWRPSADDIEADDLVAGELKADDLADELPF
jgi:hypothetical protein